MPVPYFTQPLFKLTLTNTLPCCYLFRYLQTCCQYNCIMFQLTKKPLPIVLSPFTISVISQIFSSFLFLGSCSNFLVCLSNSRILHIFFYLYYYYLLFIYIYIFYFFFIFFLYPFFFISSLFSLRLLIFFK